jgi:hypothetical protein
MSPLRKEKEPRPEKTAGQIFSRRFRKVLRAMNTLG